jgi:hypothetical protein
LGQVDETKQKDLENKGKAGRQGIQERYEFYEIETEQNQVMPAIIIKQASSSE